MPLVLKLHLVMMCKYSKLGVDTFMIYIKILHDDDNDDDLATTVTRLFLWNRRVKIQTFV